MEKKEPIDKRSKADRVLRMYDLLMRGKVINKTDAGQKFGVDEKTIQRDLDDIRCYLNERVNDFGIQNELIYDRRKNGYRLEQEEGMRSASELAKVIWNLVRLGYADAVYSEEEKEIVNYLIDKWSVAPEVYQEFIDTAETLLSLKQYKSWISTAYVKRSIGEEKKKNVEDEMQMLLDDVQLTINELTM